MTEPGLGGRIRSEIEQGILSGALPVGSRLPTEHALMARHGCARMTVHKVLADLAARGLVTRRRRLGTFVAAPAGERALLAIADFGEEAERLGRVYGHLVLDRQAVRAAGAPFTPGEALVFVRCLHLFDAEPVALEERMIRVGAVPPMAPDAFVGEPPGRWLLRQVPWSRAHHTITASLADAAQAVLLEVPVASALLCLHRRTEHAGAPVTDVDLAFPAARYRLTASFSPEGIG